MAGIRSAHAVVAARAPATRVEFAERLRRLQARTVESLLEMGRTLIAAKEGLPHGDFGKLVNDDLGWNLSGAERLMAVARNPILSNSATSPSLPPSSEALYELSQLHPVALAWAIRHGAVTPEITVRYARSLVRRLWQNLDVAYSITGDELRELLKDHVREDIADSMTDDELRAALKAYVEEQREERRGGGRGGSDPTPLKTLKVNFATWKDFNEFAALVGQQWLWACPTTRSIWYPHGAELARSAEEDDLDDPPDLVELTEEERETLEGDDPPEL
jgi:hypothetical protein